MIKQEVCPVKEQFLEAGKILNTHGIRGELKLQPWCDSPEFLCGLSTLYVDGKAVSVRSARVHKGNVLVSLAGVDDIDAALSYKNKVVYLSRDDVELPEGRHFVADLIGLEVRDAATGQAIGVLREVLNYPAQDIYVVRGEREYLIPAVDAFIRETNPEEGYLSVNMLEGLAADEN